MVVVVYNFLLHNFRKEPLLVRLNLYQSSQLLSNNKPKALIRLISFSKRELFELKGRVTTKFIQIIRHIFKNLNHYNKIIYDYTL